MTKSIVCRCEEVSIEDIEETMKKFNCTAREAKLRTRAGMGYCGGRTCRPLIDAALEQVSHEQPIDEVPLKVRPPIRPISLSSLGGEGNE